jgi:FMN reductase
VRAGIGVRARAGKYEYLEWKMANSNSLRVVAIGGSLKENSASLASLQTAAAECARLGADVTVLDLKKLNFPMFSPAGEKNPPEEIKQYLALARSADAFIWASPMYNGSISGAFKNALDWLHPLKEDDPPFLSNKVIAFIATAGGVQGLQVINTMDFSARSLRGIIVPLSVIVAKAPEAFVEGRWVDEEVVKQLRMLGQEVFRMAKATEQARAPRVQAATAG